MIHSAASGAFCMEREKMAKGKNTTVFFCQNCGYESSKWMGQCPGCKEWNTFVEESVSKASAGGRASAVSDRRDRVAPAVLSEVTVGERA